MGGLRFKIEITAIAGVDTVELRSQLATLVNASFSCIHICCRRELLLSLYETTYPTREWLTSLRARDKTLELPSSGRSTSFAFGRVFKGEICYSGSEGAMSSFLSSSEPVSGSESLSSTFVSSFFSSFSDSST